MSDIDKEYDEIMAGGWTPEEVEYFDNLIRDLVQEAVGKSVEQCRCELADIVLAGLSKEV